MVKEERFTFTSSQGSVQIHGMRWIPEEPVKAVFQICHGMSEYIERYRGFANYLAGQGIAVVGHDHLGHGDSVSSKEDYGYFAENDGNKFLLADIHKVVRMTKKKYKKVPYIMLGHSMGSFLVRQYLCMHGTELQGAIICGTGYYSYPMTKFAMLLAKSESKMRGWKFRSGLLWWMTFGNYNARFRPNRTDSDWLCRDEEVVDTYIKDPKCGFAFTLNGYYNMFLGMSKIVRKEYLQKMPKDLPVFLISGDQDPVGNFGKGVRRVSQLFKENGMENVEFRLYKDDRHELLNELDKEQVYGDITDWLRKNGLVP